MLLWAVAGKWRMHRFQRFFPNLYVNHFAFNKAPFFHTVTNTLTSQHNLIFPPEKAKDVLSFRWAINKFLEGKLRVILENIFKWIQRPIEDEKLISNGASHILGPCNGIFYLLQNCWTDVTAPSQENGPVFKATFLKVQKYINVSLHLLGIVTNNHNGVILLFYLLD